MIGAQYYHKLAAAAEMSVSSIPSFDFWECISTRVNKFIGKLTKFDPDDGNEPKDCQENK